MISINRHICVAAAAVYGGHAMDQSNSDKHGKWGKIIYGAKFQTSVGVKGKLPSVGWKGFKWSKPLFEEKLARVITTAASNCFSNGRWTQVQLVGADGITVDGKIVYVRPQDFKEIKDQDSVEDRLRDFEKSLFEEGEAHDAPDRQAKGMSNLRRFDKWTSGWKPGGEWLRSMPKRETYVLKANTIFGRKSPEVTRTFQQWRDDVVKPLMGRITSSNSATLEHLVTPAQKKRLQEIHDALVGFKWQRDGDEKLMTKRRKLLTAFFYECRAFSVNVEIDLPAMPSLTFELNLNESEKQIEGPLRVWEAFVNLVFDQSQNTTHGGAGTAATYSTTLKVSAQYDFSRFNHLVVPRNAAAPTGQRHFGSFRNEFEGRTITAWSTDGSTWHPADRGALQRASQSGGDFHVKFDFSLDLPKNKQAAIDGFIKHANTPAAPPVGDARGGIGNVWTAGEGDTAHIDAQGRLFVSSIQHNISSWISRR